MEHTPPQFFHRGPAPIARLTFFALLSVLLMVLDARFRYAEPLRQVLAIAAYPLQQLAIAPVSAVARAREFFTTQSELRNQNAQLRAEKLRDAEDLPARHALRAENEQLRRLLAARERAPTESVFAEIVYAGRDPFSRKVIIDRGAQSGVRTGQPVVDADGLLGQITRVQPLLAEVTLIIDKDHAVPVQVVRNGLRGIVYGSGDGSTLELRHMASNAEVEVGDVLVTSGLDGLYPRGLPVAKVAKIEREASQAFARIVGHPIAATSQNRQVLVLQRMEDTPAWEAEQAKSAKRGAKTKRARKSE
jgi:rod shape-determining protein MreC